jgi:hypothetical protein
LTFNLCLGVEFGDVLMLSLQLPTVPDVKRDSGRICVVAPDLANHAGFFFARGSVRGGQETVPCFKGLDMLKGKSDVTV